MKNRSSILAVRSQFNVPDNTEVLILSHDYISGFWEFVVKINWTHCLPETIEFKVSRMSAIS